MSQETELLSAQMSEQNVYFGVPSPYPSLGRGPLNYALLLQGLKSWSCLLLLVKKAQLESLTICPMHLIFISIII